MPLHASGHAVGGGIPRRNVAQPIGFSTWHGIFLARINKHDLINTLAFIIQITVDIQRVRVTYIKRVGVAKITTPVRTTKFTIG